MSKPSHRDASRSREVILRAAEDLFSRLGYERVSLATIAELARVSRGLPSYFFTDKQTLYRAVMEQAAAQNRRSVLEVVRSMKDNDAQRIFLRLIDRYIDYLAANPRVVRLLQWEALETATKRTPSGASGIPLRVFREASKVISERIGTKTIRGMDVDDLLLSIVAMCLYPFQVMPTDDATVTSFVKKHKRHVSLIVIRTIGETI